MLRIEMQTFDALVPLDHGYASRPLADAFDWRLVASELSLGAEWYLVAFRSVRRVDADEERLTAFDDRAHVEAVSAPGFIHYFKGPVSTDGSCLSFCLWGSRADARSAAALPGPPGSGHAHRRDVCQLHARIPARVPRGQHPDVRAVFRGADRGLTIGPPRPIAGDRPPGAGDLPVGPASPRGAPPSGSRFGGVAACVRPCHRRVWSRPNISLGDLERGAPDAKPDARDHAADRRDTKDHRVDEQAHGERRVLRDAQPSGRSGRRSVRTSRRLPVPPAPNRR